VKKYLVLVALPLLLVLGALSPSYAGTDGGAYGTLSVGDVSSLPDDCARATVRFQTVESPESWEFVGEIAGPSGSWVDDLSFSPGFTTHTFVVCGYDDQGTYTASGTLSLYDGSGVTEHFSTTFSYTIREKVSASIAVTTKRSSAKPCPGKANAHCWRVSVVVKRAGKPWAGRRVTMQGYDYAWQNLWSCTANKQGKCGWYVQVKRRGAGRFPLRVVSGETSTTKAAVSRTFRLRY
jgi:hypothetical protein